MKDTNRFICPFCEIHKLQPHGRDSTRCPLCGLFGGVFLKTLREISALPETIGAHACECGHPEMRRLPDGVYRCPACGLEVLPILPPRPGRSRQP
jgi:ribosomal protein L37AE/L43A